MVNYRLFYGSPRYTFLVISLLKLFLGKREIHPGGRFLPGHTSHTAVSRAYPLPRTAVCHDYHTFPFSKTALHPSPPWSPALSRSSRRAPLRDQNECRLSLSPKSRPPEQRHTFPGKDKTVDGKIFPTYIQNVRSPTAWLLRPPAAPACAAGQGSRCECPRSSRRSKSPYPKCPCSGLLVC